MNKRVMITGANGGLGKEAARQVAELQETDKVYLACRNPERAETAKLDLERITGRQIFEVLIMDTSDIQSVKTAVSELKEPIDALIMNAGGMGGKQPQTITKEGVTQMFAVNVLGHVVLVDELLRTRKLNNVAMYASSEAARGIDKMSIAKPKLDTYSVEEFISIFDGSFFDKFDVMKAYAYTKYAATLWMSAMARQHKDIRFISVSPGSTSGTDAMENLPPAMKFMFKYVMMPIVMPLRGMVHKLETGAKRYVDSISDPAYQSGNFYASEQSKIVGPMVEQSPIFPDLKNPSFQDNAEKAIRQILKAA